MSLLASLRNRLAVDEWNIGFAEMELRDLVGKRGHAGAQRIVSPVRWLHKPWFVRVQADPCLLEHDGRLYLYYEELLAGSTRGRLRWTELTATGALPRRGAPMINLREHAAYPYVFEHQGTFYCVPETGQSMRVTLYASDAPWGPWSRRSVLLEGVGARDSTVFRFDDRWWLFSTVAGTDPQSSQAELHIWHAPEPWGPWAPHALQPAKTDLRSSRPAGRPFTLDGVLYRPAQDGFPQYGARTVINRILTLTPSEFVEEVCSAVEPDPREPYGERLHTLAGTGGLVVIDGCRNRLTPNPFKMAMAIVVKVRRRL